MNTPFTRLLVLALPLLIWGCAKTNQSKTARASTPSQIQNLPLWEEAKQIAIDAEKTPSKQKSAELSEKGITLSKECIMKHPENAACYYYKAVNTGLYYKAHIVGYQNGLKEMVADLNHSIKLDETYDYAGAYRMLGQIYVSTPERRDTTSGKIYRDYDKAEMYFTKAVKIAPDYPENHIELTELLLKKDNVKTAEESLNTIDKLVPYWTAQREYSSWMTRTDQLRGDIVKRTR